MWKELTTAEQQLLYETLFPNGLSMPATKEKITISAARSIGVLVKKNNAPGIDDADTAYLHKVFGTKSLKLVRDDYAIIDATNLSGKEINALIQLNNLKIVFGFNINPQLIKVNTRIPYQAFVQDGVTYVFAHSVDVFKESREYRELMLVALTGLFGESK